MTYFKGIQILTLADPLAQAQNTLVIAPTPTHKPVSSPSPPCFPPYIPTDWGAVYRNLPLLSYLLSFLPSILICPSGCLASPSLTQPLPLLLPPFSTVPPLPSTHTFRSCNQGEYFKIKASDRMTVSDTWIKNQTRSYPNTSSPWHQVN